MNYQFESGQIVRYKKSKDNLFEDDDYFVVLGYRESELWIQVINTNFNYKSGVSIVTESENDYEVVETFGYHLINTEVHLYEPYTDEIVKGTITFVEDLDNPITYHKSIKGLESNIKFGMGDDSYPTLQGKLVVEFPDVFYA